MSKLTRRVPGAFCVFAALVAAVAAFASGEGPPSKAEAGAAQAPAAMSIDPPAPPGSTYPAVAAEGATTLTREHEILMTWLEPGESRGRLRFARFSGETWGEPVTVADGVSTLGPMDRPSLTVIDTQGVRRTLIARTGDVVARSGDAGRTWARLPAPALPFASFAGGEEGAYVFWLDAAGPGPARLLGTRVLAGETLLDPRAAGGSGTSAAMTWDGPVVVYRAERETGAREVTLIRRQDARWSEPRPIFAEDRPGSGSSPRVAALGRRVAVVWSAAEGPRSRVLVAFSSDAGRTFGAPVLVAAREGASAPVESVDVALDDDGHALVLWMAAAGSPAASLHLSRVSPDGRRGTEMVLAEGLDGRPEAIPQIARAGARVAVTWMDGPTRSLRAVSVPLAGIPAPGGSPGPGETTTTRVYSGRGRVGEPVPDLGFVSLTGEEVSLASLRGSAVLLNLWATWCLPCVAEMPELVSIHERYRAEGLVVVGLSEDTAETSDKVQALVAEKALPFAVWLDPEMRIYSVFRVRGLPATFIIDREGRIVARFDRTITAGDAELGNALSRALGTP